MQKRPSRHSWEAQLRSYESTETSFRRSGSRSSPKPGHLAQSSSPSFLEAYANYVEQKRDGYDSPADSPAGPKIKAFGSEPSEARRLSVDTRKETTDSSYTSWHASSSSPGTTAFALSASAESVVPLPGHPLSRPKHSGDPLSSGGEQHEKERSLPRTMDAQKGAVAAAVNALESRFRSSQEATTTPPRHQPLLSVPSEAGHLEKLQTSSAPSSPWPNVQYDPSPRSEHPLEVCIVPRGGEGTPPPFGNGALPFGTSPDSRRGLDGRLAAALDQQPELRGKLLRLLEDQSAAEDGMIGIRVQELMKDHPDIVESLNAQFKLQTGDATGLRQALLSNVSVQLVPEAHELPANGEAARQKERRRTYMVVMRGIDSTEISGLQEELDKGALDLHNWRDLAGWLVPPRGKRYFPWCTCAVVGALLCIFFFMAGGYATFIEESGSLLPVVRPFTPHEMGQWLRYSAAWRSFDFDYLLLWGGQYLPAIKMHQGWRWITAAAVHVSFMHLLGNMLLFAALGGILERRYGTLRMLVVLMLSTLGAAFFAGAFADPCTQVVGASGAVLGFVGLTIADLAINFGDLRSALVRLAITVIAVVFFIVTAATKTNGFISNWSHLGGFVCGLFPSFLFLPDFKDRRWRKAQAVAARVRRLYKKKRVAKGPGTAAGPAQRPTNVASEPAVHLEIGRRPEEEEAAPASVLSPHPMRPVASWLDEPSEITAPTGIQAPEVAAASTLSAAASGGPNTDGGAEIAQEAVTPAGSDTQPNHRLFTEEHSDGAFIQSLPGFRKMRCCTHLLACLPSFSLGHWSGAMLPCIILGALIIVGVFTALPTYIYVHRLPHLRCQRAD